MAVYTEPVWEEPEIKSKQGKYEPVLQELIEHPNTWAKIGEYKTKDSAYQAALNLRSGRYKIPDSALNWSFVADGNKVFARYEKTETNGTRKAPRKKK